MNRPEPNVGHHVRGGADDRVEVANLAARIAALPAQDFQTRGRSTREGIPARSRLRSWWGWLLVGVAWLGTLVMFAIALLRIFDHDGAPALAAINAFTRYVYLAAYVLAIAALWKRRWWLAVANAAIVACHLYWLAPDFVPDRRFEATTAATRADGRTVHKLRIFFANVRALNQECDALWREIQEANPDIIVLVEFLGPWRGEFSKSPLSAVYPYNSGLDQVTVDSFVASRLPLKSIRDDWIAGRCIETMEVPLGASTLQVVGLHAPRPLDLHDNIYIDYWNRVFPLLGNAKHPLVVIGDFNATQYSQVYQQLKEGGLRSAHEDRGRGYVTTWPNGMAPVPPIRIDQAFLSPDIACLGVSEGQGVGSDHKPLILDVQIRDPN